MGEIVRNCRLCNKPMEASPFTFCKTCLVEREVVRNFVIKHPRLSIKEIAKATGIADENVERMIKLHLNQKVN